MSDIRALLITVLAEQFAVPAHEITDESQLVADLSADSLDQVELLMECEERFGVEIPDDIAIEWETVGDVARWLEANGARVMPAPAGGWD